DQSLDGRSVTVVRPLAGDSRSANSYHAGVLQFLKTQRGLPTPMRLDAQRTGDVQRMQAWPDNRPRSLALNPRLILSRLFGPRRKRSCARPLLIGGSLHSQAQTGWSNFSSPCSGRKYIIAGNAIMTRASGV